jgi:riboflavin transport system substrate-binding protein
VAGTRRAVAEHPGATVEVTEAGFNQAEWQDKLTAMVATGKYDLVATTNTAMPGLCAEVAKRFPKQKFVIIDGRLVHPQMYTALFNQVEEGYLAGYMAGLVTTSAMPGANKDKKVGLVIAQTFPTMDKAIRPGFERGLKDVDPAITLDVRVVGNWYDAAKAGELAQSLFDQGVDVVLSIAGGANQGVVKAAKDRGKYVLWFDSNGYSAAPGTVVGSSVVAHDEATYRAVKAWLDGKLELGKAVTLGAKDGFVSFVLDDPLFTSSVPRELRDRMAAAAERVKKGEPGLAMPEM